MEFVLFAALVIGLILLAGWLGRLPAERSELGSGRDPKPEELIHDPDWQPSKIKGQHGGWPGF